MNPVATIELEEDTATYSLASLFSAMDYAVFEFAGKTVLQLNDPPTWLIRLSGPSCGSLVLTERLPFLESFLPEAALFWGEARDGRIKSDFWTQTNVHGEQVHLLAYAVFSNGRAILLVRSAEELYKEREMWQAYAHETAMQLKTIERLRRDITTAAAELAAANAKLSELSTRDSLTGVYNRRHFEHTFGLELRRTYRSGEPLSILFLDIDHFKVINDSFGHATGDECLRSICRELEKLFQRPQDLIARLGGEEFAILLPATNAGAALQRAAVVNQVIRDLEIACSVSEVPVRVTVSIGVYTRPPRGNETMAEILRHVDDALYRAKRTGRDRAVFASRFDVPAT